MESPSAGLRSIRGSLCALGQTGTPQPVAVFQFNPDSLVRSLRRREGRETSGSADPRRIYGAPSETISMTIELEAADAFVGQKYPDIAAQLAELELLLYPTSASVAANDDLLDQGTIEILPAEGPLLVLSWGSRRSIPVRLESLQITEQAFDPWLCPVRATVEVSLQVLSYNDLLRGDRGRSQFRTYHEGLEKMRAKPQEVPAGHPGAPAQPGGTS